MKKRSKGAVFALIAALACLGIEKGALGGVRSMFRPSRILSKWTRQHRRAQQQRTQLQQAQQQQWTQPQWGGAFVSSGKAIRGGAQRAWGAAGDQFTMVGRGMQRRINQLQEYQYALSDRAIAAGDAAPGEIFQQRVVDLGKATGQAAGQFAQWAREAPGQIYGQIRTGLEPVGPWIREAPGQAQQWAQQAPGRAQIFYTERLEPRIQAIKEWHMQRGLRQRVWDAIPSISSPQAQDRWRQFWGRN